MISDYLKPHSVKVGEGKENDDEYVLTRLDHVTPVGNIVNIYGQQETRTANDKILDSWRLEACQGYGKAEELYYIE